MLNPENKKIIVTGAASGIGKAITFQCVESGAFVLAVDIDASGLEALQKGTGEEKIQTYIADVSRFDQVEQFFNAIEKSGDRYPDCLVNNAGIYYGKSIFEYSEAEIDRVLAVDIKSAVYSSKRFAHYKIKNREKGSIINISSVSGQEGSSDAIYGLSKAALIGLTKSNAMNFSPYVRVNAIAPGVVDTPMMKTIAEKRLSAYREQELVADPIKPEDVAHSVLFLLSERARNYTGAVFDINNGCYLR